VVVKGSGHWLMEEAPGEVMLEMGTSLIED